VGSAIQRWIWLGAGLLGLAARSRFQRLLAAAHTLRALICGALASATISAYDDRPDPWLDALLWFGVGVGLCAGWDVSHRMR
jgi:hypothetical protein